MSAGVVVEHHLAPAGHAGQREDHVHRSPGHDPCRRDDAVAIHFGRERDLPASRRGDLAGEIGPDTRGDAARVKS